MFKVLDEVCVPKRSTKYSAYVDLFAREDVVIGTGETKIIPLGVKISLDGLKKKIKKNIFEKAQPPKNINKDMYLIEAYIKHHIDKFLYSHYLEIALRSSLAVKGLIISNGIGVVDLDFVPHCKINKSLNNGYCKHFKKRKEQDEKTKL